MCILREKAHPDEYEAIPKSKETYDPLYFTIQDIACCEWFHKNRLLIIIIIIIIIITTNNINSACSYAH